MSAVWTRDPNLTSSQILISTFASAVAFFVFLSSAESGKRTRTCTSQ